MTRYYSHGKLLLSGEYLILDGAVGLALPTIPGQDLVVEEDDSGLIRWESVDEKEQVWFSAELGLEDFEIVQIKGEQQVGDQLQRILRNVRKMNPRFLITSKGCSVRTALEFSRDWGLGSSSTLINNIAKWADRNPFQLLEKSFGGSGYDIACANSEKPLFFRLEGGKPKALQVDFAPSFKSDLYFVHLNRKQSSRESIAVYEEIQDFSDQTLDHISAIGKEIARCQSRKDFDMLIREHERIIGKVLGQIPVQEELFADFSGQIKSLGAWGGDFVLASSEKDPKNYFHKKGFQTIIPYKDLIL